MTKRISSLIAASAVVGMASFGLAGAASATVMQIASDVHFDLTNTHCANNGSTCSLTRQFTAFDNSTRTVNVTATAWSITDGNGWNGRNHERARLNRYSSGLGVTSFGQGGDPNNGSPNHTLDNMGANEYIVLQFDQQVSATAIRTAIFNTVRDQYGNWYGDGDTNVFVGDTQTGFWNWMDPLAALGDIDTGLNRRDNYGGPFASNNNYYGGFTRYDTDTFDFGATFGNTVVVSADLFGSDHYGDALKLKWLNVDIFEMGPGNSVPAPGALALLGLGVAGLAAARRRAAR